MDVRTPSGKLVKVPGHFAADGNAAQSSANSGNKWRAYFLPREIGEYRVVTSFRQGSWVAISTNKSAGSAGLGDGLVKTFVVQATNKKGRDHRGKGKLNYVGERYLKFDNGEYFVKAGADAPENMLAFGEFDQTKNKKDFAEHVKHFNSGDPTWKNGKGKGIIGAVNYLHEQGMNVFSFLPLNIIGDGKDVWPYISDSSSNFDRFDVSKLDQWEILFDHADKKGMYLHFKTQETENDGLLDNGNLGNLRKLYYRELVSRFAHHHAMNWNLGEEWDRAGETNGDVKQMLGSYARYIRDLDPYDNHIVVHTYPNQQSAIYNPVLGETDILTGLSVQTGVSNVYRDTLRWVQASENSGHKWVVANDEQGGAQVGVAADASYPNRGSAGDNRDTVRKDTLWGNLMAGGAGVEYYFGYSTGCTDLTCDDYSSRHTKWQDANRAIQFFDRYLPYWKMDPRQRTTSIYQLEQPGKIYVVYNKSGGATTAEVTSGTYEIRWFRAKQTSGAPIELLKGTKSTVSGAGELSLGSAPFSGDSVALLIASGYSYRTNRGQMSLGGSSPAPTPTPSPDPDPVSCNDPQVFDANSQNQIVIEAESGQLKGKWRLRNDVSGYSGNGFLVYLRDEFKPNLMNHKYDGVSEIVYEFNVKSAGTYTFDYKGARYRGGQNIKMCPAHDKTCCPSTSNTCTMADLNNDLFLGSTGKSPTKAYIGVGKSFESWKSNSKFDDAQGKYTPKLFLGVGKHQLIIRGRSNMFAVDKFIIYKDTRPSLSASESNRICK